ncbi:metallophosphoesterase [Marinilabilia sp.]|uniref:metallophosphoesterase n=1 Tax=Marinilabilia sp. TaxID=2021252 RepID=UPI0025C6F182|nr:metallophosphoesterase [Marinilabilia sp.]
MKVQYCSDLHLEFPQNTQYFQDNPIEPIGDILILAGDITYWGKKHFKHWFFDYVSENFNAVYNIPGNHEFYTGKEVQILDKPVFESLRENVFLVNNKVVNIDGIALFFTAFWSHIPDNESLIVERRINDFYKIRHKGKKLRSGDFNRLHEESLDFLSRELHNSTADKKIVVTHHIPTDLCNPEQFKNSMINPAFVSEHRDFISDNHIDYWIYGHHHVNMPEVEINGTKLLTNQLGYVHLGEHHSYRRNAVIEIK